MSVQPASVRPDFKDASARRALEWAIAHRWTLVVWSAVAIWSVVLFAAVRDDFLNFGLSSKYDLGNMLQAVWSTAHGHPLEMTGGYGVNVSRLRYHVDPILVLETPFWMIWSSPLSLAAVQVGACALGALPVFWLGRRRLGSEKAATLIALAYLMYPWLAWTSWDAIHPVTLAIPLSLYAIWFLETEKLAHFAVCAALIAATGELMGLTVAALGVWYALARGHRVAGAVAAVLGAGWSILAVKLIIPAFLGHESIYYTQYDAVGGSPGGIIRTLFTDPGVLASKLFSGDNLGYWLWLAAPLLGLFALAPSLALVALPALLVNGLSSRVAQSDPRAHYVGGLIPFLIAASVIGAARLPPRHRVRVAAALFAVSTVMLVALGPFPGTPLRDATQVASRPDSAHVGALRRAVALIPDGAPVTASKALRPSLGTRRYLYTFPFVKRSDWVVLDIGFSAPYWNVDERIPARLERDRRWVKVFSQDGVLVFRRVAAA